MPTFIHESCTVLVNVPLLLNSGTGNIKTRKPVKREKNKCAPIIKGKICDFKSKSQIIPKVTSISKIIQNSGDSDLTT